MSESLFSRLFHYRESEKLSPRENYLTEMLAWMIGNLKQFGHDYVEFLMTKCENKTSFDSSKSYSVCVRTQVNVKYEEKDHFKNRFIDMVINTTGDMGFICEHKVDSEVRENQIQEYASCQEQLNGSPNHKFKTVLLTKSTEQHTEKADISITWYDVYKYFSEKFNKGEYNCKPEEKIIIDQFLMYLTEVGMGKRETINANAVEYYCDAMKLETVLKSIFNDICTDVKWEEKFPRKKDFLTDFDPFVSKETYSRNEIRRLGIEFTRNWNPGLFAGVQMNNDDDSLQSFDSPQLTVIIDCMEGKKSKYQNEGWFASIAKDKQSKEEIETGFHIQTDSDNPWRVLILHKPLTEVLKGTRYEEQKKDIKDEIVSGINLILKYYNDNM